MVRHSYHSIRNRNKREVSSMNTAKELTEGIIQIMKDAGMSIEIVRDDPESDPIERVTDVDVTVGHSIYNVRLTVVRFKG